MKNIDLHIHTTYSDGINTPLEIVKYAINNGVETIGFSDHSFTSFDTSYCVKKEDISSYKREISSLKQEYKEKINIFLGIEQDYYSDEDTTDYEYVIGSVHYIKVDDDYIPVDESVEILKAAIDKYFCGDIYTLIECYYDTVADIVNKTNADIIGHFDLISKFNENGELFDEKNVRYINAYKKACDKLIDHNRLFEINTGAISRGYRTTPYPSIEIHNYLKSIGAKFILSSDSHCCETLCYKFDKHIDKI